MPSIEPIHGPQELVAFAAQCEDALLHGIKHEFHYPPHSTAANWPMEEIATKNEDFLSQLRGAGNVYAIFEAESEGVQTWVLRYVGERKSDGLRQRLTEHLIKKNAQTGSKLAEIQAAVGGGKRIAVSYIKVSPETLRLYVEETIIAKHKPALPWNNHG